MLLIENSLIPNSFAAVNKSGLSDDTQTADAVGTSVLASSKTQTQQSRSTSSGFERTSNPVEKTSSLSSSNQVLYAPTARSVIADGSMQPVRAVDDSKNQMLLENYAVLKQTKSTLFVHFVEENVNSPFSCYAVTKRVAGRKALDIEFTPKTVTFDEVATTIKRLEHWESNWSISWVAQVGATMSSGASDPAASTVAHLDVWLDDPLWGEKGKMAVAAVDSSKWGNAGNGNKFCPGEMRLLLMALPVHSSKKRADTHLWPKGTFIQITPSEIGVDKPIRIEQRKQQAHDLEEWKG